jgi:hypothetical protein
MSNNSDRFGSSPKAKSDWSRAWKAVSRLAAARDDLHDPEPLLYRPRAETAAKEHAPDGRRSAQRAVPIERQPIVMLEEDEITQALADIERASAMLRRTEPGLEMRLPTSLTRLESRKYRSVWILIGAIWISATLVVASTAGAILYIFG